MTAIVSLSELRWQKDILDILNLRSTTGPRYVELKTLKTICFPLMLQFITLFMCWLKTQWNSAITFTLLLLLSNDKQEITDSTKMTFHLMSKEFHRVLYAGHKMANCTLGILRN